MHAKHRLVVLVGLLGLLVWSCGGSSPTQPGVAATPACQTNDNQPLARGSTRGALLSGWCREYLAHVPPSYDASRPMPLLIAMHGYTGTPDSMESYTGLSRTADAEGFIVVYPGGLQNTWDLALGGRDIQFLRALITSLETRANIDRRRIYVTGHSMGGAMSSQAGCELADVVAAVAPVSGGHSSYNMCSPQRPISILVIHGSADTVVPPDSNSPIGPPLRVWVQAWAERNRCAASPVVSQAQGVVESVWPNCAGGSEVRLKLVQGLDHSWWLLANDELWRFFERHSL